MRLLECDGEEDLPRAFPTLYVGDDLDAVIFRSTADYAGRPWRDYCIFEEDDGLLVLGKIFSIFTDPRHPERFVLLVRDYYEVEERPEGSFDPRNLAWHIMEIGAEWRVIDAAALRSTAYVLPVLSSTVQEDVSGLPSLVFYIDPDCYKTEFEP